MLRNQAEALLLHEHIRTTVPKAKELRPFVEHLISIAKRGEAASAGTQAEVAGRRLHARRLVLRDLTDEEAVRKLFDTIGPRFASRPGGYTRVLRLGHRASDATEMAQIELVGSEFNPKAAVKEPAKEPKAAEAKPKGVGGRLRAAAARIRGKKPESTPVEQEAKGSARKPASGPRAAKKTPQKKGT
jgi:large subunit ribosomal protein L17